MRRISEGPLLGESQLREALEHLLNGLTAGDCKRRYSRSLEPSLRAALKNIDLKPPGEPTGVASRIPAKKNSRGWQGCSYLSICSRGEAIG